MTLMIISFVFAIATHMLDAIRDAKVHLTIGRKHYHGWELAMMIVLAISAGLFGIELQFESLEPLDTLGIIGLYVLIHTFIRFSVFNLTYNAVYGHNREYTGMTEFVDKLLKNSSPALKITLYVGSMFVAAVLTTTLYKWNLEWF